MSGASLQLWQSHNQLLSASACCIRNAAVCHLCLKCHERCTWPRAGEKQPATKPSVREAGRDRHRTCGTRERRAANPRRQEARLRRSTSEGFFLVCRRGWTERLAVNGRCNGAASGRAHATDPLLTFHRPGGRSRRCTASWCLYAAQFAGRFWLDSASRVGRRIGGRSERCRGKCDRIHLRPDHGYDAWASFPTTLRRPGRVVTQNTSKSSVFQRAPDMFCNGFSCEGWGEAFHWSYVIVHHPYTPPRHPDTDS